jgi:hypothetical protein
MPAKEIMACANGSEGKELLLASFKRSAEKGATGSPTIFIGGAKYEGSRKPTDLMKGICNAATGKKPAGCSDIPESPKVNVTILGDKRCGTDCDTAGLEGGIRQHIANPVITQLDYSSPEGKKLFSTIKPVMLPARAPAIDFSIHYIGDGDASSLSSMHGAPEVEEDRREACVIKHYPKQYMDYIWCRDKAINDANWQACTGKGTPFDTDAIKTCSEGDEGKQLLAGSFADSKAAGIGASPTWIANNRYKFSGVDAETIKENICAHNKLPGCDNKLSGQAAPAGGGQQPGCGQ